MLRLQVLCDEYHVAARPGLGILITIHTHTSYPYILILVVIVIVIVILRVSASSGWAGETSARRVPALANMVNVIAFLDYDYEYE